MNARKLDGTFNVTLIIYCKKKRVISTLPWLAQLHCSEVVYIYYIV